MQTSKQKKTRPVNCVMLESGITLSYDNPLDFEAAWPGIAMMMAVMSGEGIGNPAYKGAKCGNNEG